MRGFLFDENLPSKLHLQPSLPILHARDLGESRTDADLWAHAQLHHLIIVTKDADFSDRMLIAEPPPKVVHLRFGNMRLAAFQAYLARVWPRVELLLRTNKLVTIYHDRLEAVA